MKNNKINIISFNVPFPANYGGVIDVFYKIKALHKAGFEIVLHCFQYGRPREPELEKFCTRVHYYKRSQGVRYLFSKIPYIAITRNNINLLNNLKSNNYPILFEGLHTCLLFQNEEIRKRKTIVRMHNIEHHYYAELSKASRNPLKKMYFRMESQKLKKFEHVVTSATSIAAISKNDLAYFSKINQNAVYIPAFHSANNIKSQSGKGNFFLYHGNLAVEENEKAALFLIEQVFSELNTKLIIAGSSPTPLIQKHAKGKSNIQLLGNPKEAQMNDLISKAHCCIIPTFQSTGLKLKLLNSLFMGRFVLTNNEMIENTGLESICELANSSSAFIDKVNQIESKDFSVAELQKRKLILEKYTNQSLGKQLISLINNL